MNCKKVKFFGKEAIEIKTKTFKIIVLTEVGPRIAFFGKIDSKNLLFWDNENRSRGEWKLMGGHRIWVWRVDADESEDAYREDNFPCEVKINKNFITVIGAKDPVFNIKKGLSIKIENNNKVYIDNFIINTGDMLYSCGVWSLTCTDPNFRGVKYGIPLGDNSQWDCFRLVMFKKWGGGHTSHFNDNQIIFTEDMLIVEPKGIETKRMIEAPYGIICMDIPEYQTTFIKKITYIPGAKYPYGCNLAFYVGPENFMVEMEAMSPSNTLKPGETIHLIETWILTDKNIGLNSKKLIGMFKN